MRTGRGAAAPYGIAIGTVVVSTIATFALKTWMGSSVSLLFFPAIIVSAEYGYGPAAAAAAASTIAIAYFFVPPIYVFDFGLDDVIRLSVFTGVGSIGAWLSGRRRRAEDALRESLAELENNLRTLQRVSGWPTLIGPDAAASIKRMLDHAAGIVGASAAAVIWETEDEPWVYLATTTDPGGIVENAASVFGDWRHEPTHPAIAACIGDRGHVSAIFETEYVAGRVYFTGVKTSTADLTPTLSLVAHEVGNSLGQLQLADRIRQLAVHEDRIRVSRDLHDGVLQGLTGIRLELQAIADTPGADADRLRAIERALAIEQRELRMFIDELKPAAHGPAQSGPIATRLAEMCTRFSAEWKVPVTLRVTPVDMTLPQTVEQAVRLMLHEAVSNALKHGHPSRVAIDVEGMDAQLKITVSDDGLGFPFRGRYEHDELAGFSAGPVSLRERVSSLDGRLAVESWPTGSRVEFVIPVTARSADAG